MRDRPSGSILAALAAELPDEKALVTRCSAIAAREARYGDEAFAEIRARLAERYGEGDDRALLQNLAAEIRAGVFDRPDGARLWLARFLWDLTRAKLRESNPELLAVSGLTEM